MARSRVVENDVAALAPVRHTSADGALQTCRFALAGDEPVSVLDVEVDETADLEAAVDEPTRHWSTVAADHRTIAVETRQHRHEAGLARFAACRIGENGADAAREATVAVESAAALGVPALRRRNHEVWDERWRMVSASIPDDLESQEGLRFAIYHLHGAASPGAECAIGPRGLTGPGYIGHVFWDADVFVLPALTAIEPRAARAMLQYRIARLDAARKRAADEGRRGARFPWESAHSGFEVTPTEMVGHNGEIVPILTGEQEIHIGADIAWAAHRYATWTGDDTFLTGPGRDLVIETARYWADRVEIDADGSGHLRGVIGPDEYHEDVDDNAFTNQMAAWNLRLAAQLSRSSHEVDRWLATADALVTGYDPTFGRHHQFAGFDELDPMLIWSITNPPVAADLLLGRDTTLNSQVVKQADVVMLHHMIPDELPAGSIDRDLDHYLPRTSHGSSLSPAIHAAVLARADRADEALRWFRIAARLDLDDLTGTTPGGVHLATMGGAWQAFVSGFLGLQPAVGDAIVLDPRLPPAWGRVELRCHIRGRTLTIEADHDRFTASVDRAIEIRTPAIDGGGTAAFGRSVTGRWNDDRWEVST